MEHNAFVPGDCSVSHPDNLYVDVSFKLVFSGACNGVNGVSPGFRQWSIMHLFQGLFCALHIRQWIVSDVSGNLTELRHGGFRDEGLCQSCLAGQWAQLS